MEILTLQDGIAFDASDLNGTSILTSRYFSIITWFTPAASYDGTVTFEISPDEGTTWFPIETFAISDSITKLTSIATPTTATLYRTFIPSECIFRVRMSGGTQGTLTVKARQGY